MIPVKPLRNIPYWKAVVAFAVASTFSMLVTRHLSVFAGADAALANLAGAASAILTFAVLLCAFGKARAQEATGVPAKFSMRDVATRFALLALTAWLLFASRLGRDDKLVVLSLSFNVVAFSEFFSVVIARLLCREAVAKGLRELLCAYRNR